MSLLHLDIEWYTTSRDPESTVKFRAIREAINSALPHAVKILEEDLSRHICAGKYKNSFHLYPMVTLPHNAQGCMRPLVTEKIWGSLKNRRDMFCELTKKPVIDLSVYTKNRNFRVPGSSKYDGFYWAPLPSREFFMATRMADRIGFPDRTIEQLKLKGTMTIRSSSAFIPRKQGGTRKRQLVSSYAGRMKSHQANPISLQDSKPAKLNLNKTSSQSWSELCRKGRRLDISKKKPAKNLAHEKSERSHENLSTQNH